MQFPSRRTNSPGKEWNYSSVGRKNSPGAIFPSDGRIDFTILETSFKEIYFKYHKKLRIYGKHNTNGKTQNNMTLTKDASASIYAFYTTCSIAKLKKKHSKIVLVILV
jgi:hypothetical protein